MISKLIKTEVNYLLENEEGIIIASTSLKKEGLALSLKNCQAIENGYDLDEIVEQTKQTLDDSRISSYDSFRIGMETILEILGDKKFSEKDIERAFNVGVNAQFEVVQLNKTNIFDFLQTKLCGLTQSLQQTEWDVEIDDSGISIFDSRGRFIPRLDGDGCLILKRI